MCGIGGSMKAAAPKAAPTAAPIVAPLEADETVRSAGEAERRRRQAAAGRSQTILTGGLGVEGNAPVTGKTLLGQ